MIRVCTGWEHGSTRWSWGPDSTVPQQMERMRGTEHGQIIKGMETAMKLYILSLPSHDRQHRCTHATDATATFHDKNITALKRKFCVFIKISNVFLRWEINF